MPASNARVDQLVIELIGPTASEARVDQLTVELMGPPASEARVDQLVIEILGIPGTPPTPGPGHRSDEDWFTL